jgi:hypothetical protein
MAADVIPADDPALSPSSLRQAARLEDVPELYRRKHERLAVELALNVDDAEAVFASYGYTPEDAADLCEQPAFLALMQQAQKSVVADGLSFRTKAQLMAGELLPYAHDIATDPLQSAAVRADLIKWAAKVAGFEPKESKDDGKQGGGLTLNIQFAGQAPQQVLSAHQPLTITQGDEL